MPSFYALASQNVFMQLMLHLDTEIGSHSKCPRLMKFCGFAKWEPRFRAHLGSIHSDSSMCLDDEYIAPLIRDGTIGF